MPPCAGLFCWRGACRAGQSVLCAAWKWKKAARSGELGTGAGRRTVNCFADFDANLLWDHTTVITLVLLTLQPLPALSWPRETVRQAAQKSGGRLEISQRKLL